ncbi:LuxR C-terminal-related transcriptional regulator (plasmid) [Cedecea neteri]|uniref:LuxR C-terminal-related transcriptional regulator n=1 Tax=Cedecea neteri TaxID=158822 RepID=UPI002892AB14|nr:LuxR C-terminal-related transcriptional regulator [Cedecea neteri]WNJ82203.1 LuxR C-terminal-related transcriptional regulator [Cedecea neteri]
MAGKTRMFAGSVVDMSFFIKKNFSMSCVKEFNKMKIVIITDNYYLLLGIYSMITDTIGGEDTIDFEYHTSLDRSLPVSYDLLITEGIMRSVFLLFTPQQYLLNDMIEYAVESRLLPSAIKKILSEDINNWKKNNTSIPYQLTEKEREVRDYLAAGKFLCEIASLTGLNNKRISYYKQKIKKKSYCKNDAELRRALLLARISHKPVSHSEALLNKSDSG